MDIIVLMFFRGPETMAVGIPRLLKVPDAFYHTEKQPWFNEIHDFTKSNSETEWTSGLVNSTEGFPHHSTLGDKEKY